MSSVQFNKHILFSRLGFPGDSVVENLPANAGDTGLTSGSGRSPGEGNGNLLQYSCCEKIPWTEESDGVHGVAKSGTQFSD